MSTREVEPGLIVTQRDCKCPSSWHSSQDRSVHAVVTVGNRVRHTHVSPKVPQVIADFERCLSSPHRHMNLPKTQEKAIAVVQCCTKHHLAQTKVIDPARVLQEPACRKTEDTGLCVGAQLENLRLCDSWLNHC